MCAAKRKIELGVQKCRGAGVGTCFLANYSSKAKYLQGAKWRPRLSFRHLANICRSTYLLDTLFTKFWKNHIKLLHKFIGEMWKQQQHATTTYEIHFSSCFFSICYKKIITKIITTKVRAHETLIFSELFCARGWMKLFVGELGHNFYKYQFFFVKAGF